MGKYSYKTHNTKPAKLKTFIPLMAINSIITEVIFVFILMASLKTMAFNSNMLGIVPILTIGFALCLFYALVEKLCRNKWSLKWWHYPLAGYFIPIVFWGITSLITLSAWWSDRNNEDALFMRWFTFTFLIFLVVAAAFRIVGHFIYVIFDKKVTPENNKEKEKKKK